MDDGTSETFRMVIYGIAALIVESEVNRVTPRTQIPVLLELFPRTVHAWVLGRMEGEHQPPHHRRVPQVELHNVFWIQIQNMFQILTVVLLMRIFYKRCRHQRELARALQNVHHLQFVLLSVTYLVTWMMMLLMMMVYIVSYFSVTEMVNNQMMTIAFRVYLFLVLLLFAAKQM